MLAGMPRPNVLARGALVATVALALVACAAKGPTPPPVPVFHPGPTPARSVDPDLKYADAMIAKFASDPLIFHVVQTIKLTATDDTDSLRVTGSITMDASDGNTKVNLVLKAAGKTIKVDQVAIGSSIWSRIGSGRWSKGLLSTYEQDISDTVRALQPIRDSAHLTYVGVEKIDKQKLHHLTANRKFPYVMADGQRGTYDKFDIWVQEDGTPVLAKGKVSVIGAYGIEIKGTTELHYSKFGGKIKITAPKN
jgi:hypothetical protein